jgi:tRNA threonylcarbamoyladenosine biosynthesis protein TsaE
MQLSFTSHSESETITWGKDISQLLQPGDVISFFGNLGSGKTKTIQGICEGFGCGDKVSSPTFTIINEYNGKLPIYHFDLYRIDSEREIFDLGYEEYFYDHGICLIEWAERISAFLPENHIEIYLEGIFQPRNENIRRILLKPVGHLSEQRKWHELTI